MATVLKRNQWQIWKDVIFALMVREVRTGFNDKLGLSWAILHPIAFIFILSFIRGRLDGGETHSIPTFVFMAYGLLLIQLFLTVFDSASKAVKKAKPLYAFRQVQPISPVIASSLFEILVKVMVFIGISVIMYLMQMEIRVDDFLALILNVCALALFSVFFGLMFGVLSLFVPELSKMQNLLTRPLFFISGVFFSMRDVPPEYWYLLDWNPILHAIELSRYSAYTSYGNTAVSTNYLLLVTLGVVFLAMLIYRSLWKSAVSR